MSRYYNPKRYYTKTDTGDNGVLRQAYLENQNLRDKVKLWKEIAEALASQLRGYPCACNMSKCKCGHDAVLDAYEEAVNNDSPTAQ